MKSRSPTSARRRNRTIALPDEAKRLIHQAFASSRRRSTQDLLVKKEKEIPIVGRNQVEFNEAPPPGNVETVLVSSDVSSAAAPDEPATAMDEKIRAVYQMYDGEREYNWQLAVLAERIEAWINDAKKSQIAATDFQVLTYFADRISDVRFCSFALISKLEKIITTFKPPRDVDSKIGLGTLFEPHVWRRYENYHNSLRTIRPMIRAKKRSVARNLIDSFSRMEKLILLPEERVIAYNEHLDALVRCTPDDHTDYAALKCHRDYVQQKALESRRDEIRLARNEQKLEEVESQFPVDHLNLLNDKFVVCGGGGVRRLIGHSGGAMNNVKQFVGRRKSIGAATAPTWFRSSVDNGVHHTKSPTSHSTRENQVDENGENRYLKTMRGRQLQRQPLHSGLSNSTSVLNQQNFYYEQFQDKPHQHNNHNLRKPETFVRVYMKEGRVVLNSGVHTQERYLFLFSDLLLVAKENFRGVNSYRLKEKIRLCEVWLSEKSLEDVSDNVKNAQNSFIVGWPTKSYVAEFKTAEERNSWYEILTATIASVKQKERPNTTVVSVRYKNGRNDQTCEVSVNNFQTAADMLSQALSHFNVSSPDASAQHQLWVQSGREMGAYPLFGHECPFAILLSHIRDLLPEGEGEVDVSLLNDLTAGGHGIKCNFIIKKKRGLKKNKSKHGAGQFLSQVKRKMMKQDSGDSACPPSPTGKLFGLPLDTLMAEDNAIPKPILALMEHLAKEGVFMEGIFRKPPKNSTLRELKEKLDAGVDVNLDGVSPSVSASLLKEFFRQLPDSVLANDKINAWVSLCDETNQAEKMRKAKMLASQLPPPNARLLRYFLCLLHNVTSRETYNQMNSFNLGVCIAPSLSGLSRYGNLSGAAAKRMSELSQYLIDSVTDLFGEETLGLLGEIPAQKIEACGDETDILANMKQETSSLDSLTATGSSPSCSRPQSSLHYSVNMSRDSGLSEAHAPSSSDDIACTGPTTLQRCFSQSEDTEDDRPLSPPSYLNLHSRVLTTHSVDNLSCSFGAQKRFGRLSSDSDVNANVKTTHLVVQDLDGRKTAPIADSADSLYDSVESTSSNKFGARQDLVRASKRSVTSAVLTRSESGDHLYLSETLDIAPTLQTSNFNRQDMIRESRSKKTLIVNDETVTVSNAPVSLSLYLTANDSSYGSSPVSPESTTSGVDSAYSRNPSPGPSAVMARNSAYRKPARFRKALAPQPPSPTLTTNVYIFENGKELLCAEEEDSLKSKQSPSSSSSLTHDEEDSGVHLMEIHSARPIIISCNCESSSSPSSDDEKEIRRDKSTDDETLKNDSSGNTVPLTQLATPHSISEIYPLKSPAPRSAATRFIVDSVPKPAVRRQNSQSSSKEKSQKHRHSYDAAAAKLSERVHRGLELMMEKVESAHLSQEKLLPSRVVLLADSVNDSSTVTEASSEESTPHVSRESSSAQEYKQVAQGLFSSHSHSTLSKLPNSDDSMTKSLYSSGSSSRIQSRQPMLLTRNTFKAAHAPVAPTTKRKSDPPQTSVRNGFSNTALPSLPQYRATLARTTDTDYYYRKPTATTPTDSLKSRESVEAPAVRVVPMVPGQVRDRVQRYDRERLRRKTLGGEEYAVLADMSRQTPATDPIRIATTFSDQRQTCATPQKSETDFGLSNGHQNLARSTSLDRRYAAAAQREILTDTEQRPHEISWSVRHYVKLFDNAGSKSELGGTKTPEPTRSAGQKYGHHTVRQTAPVYVESHTYRRQVDQKFASSSGYTRTSSVLQNKTLSSTTMLDAANASRARPDIRTVPFENRRSVDGKNGSESFV